MSAKIMKKVAKYLRIPHPMAREGMAEFLGTFLLVLFGDASIAQSVLSHQAKGTFLSINWGWGVGVMLAVLVSGGVSGGHLNPAVSLALATAGKFPWKKVPVYMVAQYIGAFLGSALVLGVYKNAWDAFDGGVRAVNGTRATAGILATYPAEFLQTENAVADQVIGTALLVLLICAICDENNMEVPKHLIPLFVGFTLFNIGVCFGFNCGYAVNPARDFGPRVFTALAGWGDDPFSFREYNWWWIPIVGPHIGGIIGCWVYMLLVEFQHPADDVDIGASVSPGKVNPAMERHHSDSLGLANYGSMDQVKKDIE